jgi:acetyltransferase-like isoleucine patch superfamily enzyme
VSTPAARVPAAATFRHRVRAARLRAKRGVEVRGTPLVGRGVVVDVDAGAKVVLGDDCSIGDGTRIHARAGDVVVGDGAVLGERCALVALAGVEIGRRCLIGDGVVMTDFEPGLGDVERPAREQDPQAAPIDVGDGARIGHGACLLLGARVAPGASVAPHAVVRRVAP